MTGLWRRERVSRPARRGELPLAKSHPKIVLSVSRDIPFNRLVLSQSNVRRVKAGVAIEELAEDIARRTLLQSLTVRPVLDDSGADTGMYEVPAGGRRYRALELLVRQKRLARTARSRASSAPAASPRRTASPKTCSGRRCIRSTSSGRSWPCARRASRRRRSPPLSSSRSMSCASACGWLPRRRSCSTSMPRTA